MANSTPEDLNLPPAHALLLTRIAERLRSDARLVGLAAGGSLTANEVDEFSDLDLVVAVEPDAFEEVLAEREAIAAGLGSLLVAFSGEHVGEPRLLICLYDEPLLHVDLKFVSLADAAERVEDPLVLWERDGRLSAVLASRAADYPPLDLQWIEDRFWVWVHYVTAKIGRGELFEAADGITFLRGRVLGPMALLEAGHDPNGVRKLERRAPERAAALARTVARLERESCAAGLLAAAELYVELRASIALAEVVLRTDAEQAALSELARVRAATGD